MAKTPFIGTVLLVIALGVVLLVFHWSTPRDSQQSRRLRIEPTALL